MSEEYKGLFESWEIAVTKKIISEFLWKYPLLKQEGFDDLVQECLIHWLSKRAVCDLGSKSKPKTYMGRVIKNYLFHIKDKVYSVKRTLTYQCQSLDEYINTDDSSAAARKKHEPSILANPSLSIDISNALQKLTSDQKAICRLLVEEGLSPLQVSQQLKKHHSHVYREIQRIRQFFEKEGLKDYLR